MLNFQEFANSKKNIRWASQMTLPDHHYAPTASLERCPIPLISNPGPFEFWLQKFKIGLWKTRY